MPRAVLVALLAAALGTAGGILQPSSPAPPPASDLPDSLRALFEADEMQAPGDAILARQLYGSDTIPSDAFPRARSQARALAQTSGRWEFVGPVNVGGRILDVVIDPQSANTIFAAAASGGVWKSTDAGATFTSVWPDSETQAIGALAITPSGTLFAGTGEIGPGGGSLTYGGTGVYRSRDGGRSWQNVGLPASSRIGRIVVDPTDERRVFVAAGGPLYKPGGERGLYLSEDGGDTWKLVLAGENDTTGAADIAIDPADPKHILATTWDLLREPDKRRYTGTGSGLWVSSDGGATWARVLQGVLGPHPALSRIGVAFAPSDPKVVYVIATGESGANYGFYRSTDGGQTFTPSPDNATLAYEGAYVYGWWFGRVWVDPKDPNHVWVAGVSLLESTNGGVTFGTARGVHADQHSMTWDPQVPGRVYLGNDGGVYRSDANGKNWKFGESQPWSQLYGLDVSEQDPSRLVAGLQDNGSVRSYPDTWNEYNGGDGQRTLINPQDQQIVYACSQYGECGVSRNGGDTMSSFTQEVVSSRKNWFTPIEFDPENPSIVYTGGEIMSMSEDDAASWAPISPDLSNGPGRETNPLFRNFGTLTTIAPAARSKGTIYAGTDDGNLWYTHSGGGPSGWIKAADADLPKAWITRVEVNVEDPKVAYVAYSGFRTGDDAAYLLRTVDGGASWDNITGDLPKAPLNDVNLIGGDLYVASDVGVFRSRDQGKSWRRLSVGLPLAPVFELRYHRPTNTLYAGTFGRGIYRVPLASTYAEPEAAPAPTVPGVSRPVVRSPRLSLASSCIRRGRVSVRLRVRGGAKLRSARVSVRGRRTVVLRGRALRRALVLRRVRGRRVVVRVAAVTVDGARLTAARTFRVCRRR